MTVFTALFCAPKGPLVCAGLAPGALFARASIRRRQECSAARLAPGSAPATAEARRYGFVTEIKLVEDGSKVRVGSNGKSVKSGGERCASPFERRRGPLELCLRVVP